MALSSEYMIENYNSKRRPKVSLWSNSNKWAGEEFGAGLFNAHPRLVANSFLKIFNFAFNRLAQMQFYLSYDIFWLGYLH